MERWEAKENREFLRAGTIAAAVYNSVTDLKKHQPLTAYDLFNIPRPPEKKLTAKERAARIGAFFQTHNAKIVRIAERRAKRAEKKQA